MIPTGSGSEPHETSHEPDPFTGRLHRITTTPEGGEDATLLDHREPRLWPNGTPWGPDAPWLKDMPRIIGYEGCTHSGAKWWNGKQWVDC